MGNVKPFNASTPSGVSSSMSRYVMRFSVGTPPAGNKPAGSGSQASNCAAAAFWAMVVAIKFAVTPGAA